MRRINRNSPDAQFGAGRKCHGNTTLIVGALTWFDDKIPWAVFRAEEVLYNADVREYIQSKGP